MARNRGGPAAVGLVGAPGTRAIIHRSVDRKDHFGSLTLTGLTPRVFRVLCITGMDRSLNIEQAERA